MNRFCLLLSIIFLFTGAALASDTAVDHSNWGVPDEGPPFEQQAGEPAEQVWDEERDSFIENNYGSENSPAFLNTQEVPENEYEYDSDAGTEDENNFENE